MPTSIYHVRKTSLGLKHKYRISADDGNGKPGKPVGCAERQSKMSDGLDIYGDERRSEELVTVRRARRLLAALTGYEAFDHEGQLLGSFGVLPKKSCDRTTWECGQPGLGRLTGTERSVATARARRLLTPFDTVGEMAGALARSHFGFAREGEPVFSIDKPKVFDDWYRLSVHEEAVDRQLLFAPAVTMEARQRGQVRTSHRSTPTTQPASRPSSPSTAGPVPPSSVTGPPTRPGFWSSTPIATLISRARRWSICGPRSKPATQRPQIYGTQYADDGHGLRPQPVHDPDRLDERRAAMGLDSAAAYDQRMRKAYTT